MVIAMELSSVIILLVVFVIYFSVDACRFFAALLLANAAGLEARRKAWKETYQFRHAEFKGEV